jgi:hypothetical protein
VVHEEKDVLKKGAMRDSKEKKKDVKGDVPEKKEELKAEEKQATEDDKKDLKQVKKEKEKVVDNVENTFEEKKENEKEEKKLEKVEEEVRRKEEKDLDQDVSLSPSMGKMKRKGSVGLIGYVMSYFSGYQRSDQQDTGAIRPVQPIVEPPKMESQDEIEDDAEKEDSERLDGKVPFGGDLNFPAVEPSIGQRTIDSFDDFMENNLIQVEKEKQLKEFEEELQKEKMLAEYEEREMKENEEKRYLLEKELQLREESERRERAREQQMREEVHKRKEELELLLQEKNESSVRDQITRQRTGYDMAEGTFVIE